MGTSHRRWSRHGVADALREQRESMGLTRRQVAERSGLSYPYVSQLENGDREPSLDALSKLADALSISAEDLLKSAPGPLASATPMTPVRPATPALPPAPGPPASAGPTAAPSAPSGRWLKNPAYSPPPVAPSPPAVTSPQAAPSSPPGGADAVAEAAYQLLLALPPTARLDAAGIILARCVRDSSGGI